MRNRYRRLLFGVALVVVAGCQGEKPVDAKDAAARVEAAISIGDPTKRDDALSVACKDAAAVGEVDVVKKGLGRLGDPTKRDDTTFDCAIKLKDAKKLEAATEIAKRIGDPTKRDKALAKLAAG